MEDGVFPILAGASAFACGSGMLALGVPAGWALVVIACGVALVVGGLVIELDVDVDLDIWTATALAATLIIFTVGWVYATHSAEDLPRLLPGHDADSEHYRASLAFLAFASSLLAFGGVVALARPRRSHLGARGQNSGSAR